jgi:hypothetical protein
MAVSQADAEARRDRAVEKTYYAEIEAGFISPC